MEAAAPAVAVVEQPKISAQLVGNAFVQQYYHILHHSPGVVFRFYQDISKLGRPEADGSMSITTTMQAINDKILSLNYGDCRAELKSVDSQESFNGGVHVLVTGCLTGEDNLVRNFTQTFFLAPQERGYFVLTDMFRYVESVNQYSAPQVPATCAAAPVTPEGPEQDLPPVQQNQVPELSTPSVEEANEGEVYDPLENGDVPDAEEEVPVAEVVDETQDDSQMVAESNIKSEDAPKKSYASIVLHLKESGGSFSPPPAPAPRKPMEKSVEAVKQPPVTAIDGPVSISDSVNNTIKQEGEATQGYSIYVKNLPVRATMALLADEFKKFGPIKDGGIQVINNGVYAQPGYGFGFVEFESASSVQKAVEASPILIDRREVVVEEKRSRSTRGNYRGRYPSERGAEYRNDGIRGQGYHGGGRDYARSDYGGRNEFNNRDDYRGGSSNRGGYGYQRVDNRGSNDGYQRAGNRVSNDGYQRVGSRGSNDGYQRVDNRGSNDGYQRVDTRGSDDGFQRVGNRGRNDGYQRVDNRGSNDGYQRVDKRGSNVGRMNRAGGRANGTAEGRN